MSKYLHSFAILAHKESPYIEELIKSIKSQTVKSQLFISTSTPCLFIEKLSQKYNIPILINKEGKGIVSDCNFGYKNAGTRYVTLAHQDDIYLPNYTEKCIETAEKYSNTLITFTRYKELCNNQIKSLTSTLLVKDILLTPYLFKDSVSSKFVRKAMLSLGNPIACPSVMFNKEKLKDKFNFSEDFPVNFDWDIWLRLSEEEGAFILVKERLMLYRFHSGTCTATATKDNRKPEEDKKILRRLWPAPLAEIIYNLYSFGYRY